MGKSKWSLLLTESFFPFLIFMVIFLAALFVIDNKIENRDDILLINLNREDLSSDEEPSITQSIDTTYLPKITKKTGAEINMDMENQLWFQAINKIDFLKKNYGVNNPELELTLAYLHYKTGEYQKSISILESAGFESGARYYYNKGLLLGRQPGHYLDAIKNFEKFLEFKNNSYEANLNIAHIYSRMDQYKTAMKYYLKSSELSSLSRKSKALFGAAHCSEKLNSISQAIEYLNQAIDLDPENTVARVHLAELELGTNPDRSIAALIKITNLYPEYINSYHILANYYLSNDENEKAVNWLKTGLQQAPNSTLMKSKLGSIYLKMGENEKARVIFHELSEQFPGDYFYSFNLARSYFGLDTPEEAITYYLKALQIKPDYYEALVNLGIIYSKLNNPDKAILYYNKALALDKSSPGIYFNLGILYNRLDRKMEAIESYKTAITLDKKFIEAYYNLGLLYSNSRNYREAEISYLGAIRYKNDYINGYYNLSFIYKVMGKQDQIIEILQKGIHVTNSSKLKNRLAGVYLETNQIRPALDLYLDVIQDNPENVTALREISKIYISQKKFSKSLEYIEKYIYFNPKSAQGRYLNMIALYENKNLQESLKQYEILNRISPGYKDSRKYRDLIITSLN
jgi:superkiller protein 3